MGLGLRGPGVDLSSPTASVRSFFEALEDQDADRCADCWHFPATIDGEPVDREWFISGLNFGFGFMDSIDISNLDMDIIDQTGTTATVEVSYHERDVYGDGSVDEYDETDRYELVKIGDNWYITSMYVVADNVEAANTELFNLQVGMMAGMSDLEATGVTAGSVDKDSLDVTYTGVPPDIDLSGEVTITLNQANIIGTQTYGPYFTGALKAKYYFDQYGDIYDAEDQLWGGIEWSDTLLRWVES